MSRQFDRHQAHRPDASTERSSPRAGRAERSSTALARALPPALEPEECEDNACMGCDWCDLFSEPASVQVVLRSLVGTTPAGELGPSYTLSPEPMTSEAQLDEQGRPRSVWSALMALGGEGCAQLAARAYGCPLSEARQVMADALLWEATETRCYERMSDGGWVVRIDAEGLASVEVWG